MPPECSPTHAGDGLAAFQGHRLSLFSSARTVYPARLEAASAKTAVLIQISKNNSREACGVRERWPLAAPGRERGSTGLESPKSPRLRAADLLVATASELAALMAVRQGSLIENKISRPTTLSKPHYRKITPAATKSLGKKYCVFQEKVVGKGVGGGGRCSTRGHTALSHPGSAVKCNVSSGHGHKGSVLSGAVVLLGLSPL